MKKNQQEVTYESKDGIVLRIEKFVLNNHVIIALIVESKIKTETKGDNHKIIW